MSAVAALALAQGQCCQGQAIEAARPREVAVSAESVRAAVERAIPLIERSGAEYRARRDCFSCHHQALPVLALVQAKARGFTVDEQNLADQLAHTQAHLERGRDGYREGRGQGGQVDTAGWALWTLEEGGVPASDTTAAVANYLLSYQADLGHWKPPGGNRPPTQGSTFTTTYIALRGLETFATYEQKESISLRREWVIDWLKKTPAVETEDRVFRLRSLNYVGADVEQAGQELLAAQRSDGGWSQREDHATDAYATATTLVALQDSGALEVTDEAYRRGIAFLLRSQNVDGSWRVETRAKPIQVYFESGFPHGRDQFVSMSATCWAVMALLRCES